MQAVFTKDQPDLICEEGVFEKTLVPTLDKRHKLVYIGLGHDL